MTKFKIQGESKLIQGHVLDVARPPLVAALRRYDPQLYVSWNPKKRSGRGVWELRRKPEFKSVREGRYVDAPTKGRVFIPGDIFEFDDFTISIPKYHENHAENHVKDFEYLTYDMVSWVAKHDLFAYGYKGRNALAEAEYREAQYLDKVEKDADEERQYLIKDNKTAFNDFREYILAGGNPYRLVDYMNK
jgi:hypothetical protein